MIISICAVVFQPNLTSISDKKNSQQIRNTRALSQPDVGHL